MSRELPLLATASVALALRTGRQTQDRRPMLARRGGLVLRPAPTTTLHHVSVIGQAVFGDASVFPAPWQKGDLLYVREPTMVIGLHLAGAQDPSDYLVVRYDSNAVEARVVLPERIKRPMLGRRLANGCYREAAQTWLRVVDVRPERLQDITEEDAGAEGVRSDIAALGALSHIQGADVVRSVPSRLLSARDHFRDLWHSLYGAESWKANPWVWRTVLELDRERSGLNEKAVAHG